MVEKGAVPKATLDDVVRHILTSMVRVGAVRPRNTPPAISGEHRRAPGARGDGLGGGQRSVKNAGNLLPLAKNTKVAVIGPAADAFPQSSIAGSGAVDPSTKVTTPFAGIRAAID